MAHVFQATSFACEQNARVRELFPHDAEGLNHVAVALLRHKGAGAAEEEFTFLHAPAFSRSASLFGGDTLRDFHAFIDDGDAVRRKATFDETPGNVSAIGNEAIQRLESRP